MLRRFFLVLAARLCRPEDLDVSVILHDEAGRKPAQLGVLTPRTTRDEALVQMLSEGGDDSAARRWLDEQAARPARDCGLVARAEEECAT